jgi:hypothetical protein
MLTLNIGLQRSSCALQWSPRQALHALRRDGFVVRSWTVHTSDTEPTLVARCELARFHGDALAQAEVLADDLDQDCVAVLGDDGRGALVGPRPWGDFNPECFLTLEGRRLSDCQKVAA